MFYSTYLGGLFDQSKRFLVIKPPSYPLRGVKGGHQNLTENTTIHKYKLEFWYTKEPIKDLFFTLLYCLSRKTCRKHVFKEKPNQFSY